MKTMYYTDTAKGKKRILIKTKFTRTESKMISEFRAFYPVVDKNLLKISDHFKNIDKS